LKAFPFKDCLNEGAIDNSSFNNEANVVSAIGFTSVSAGQNGRVGEYNHKKAGEQSDPL
jgi:hypothetical protein